MNAFIMLLLGCWLGYELKRILDNPHEQPETTHQFLSSQEPKCKWCLTDDCDNTPEPGSYFCKEHATRQTVSP